MTMTRFSCFIKFDISNRTLHFTQLMISSGIPRAHHHDCVHAQHDLVPLAVGWSVAGVEPRDHDRVFLYRPIVTDISGY